MAICCNESLSLVVERLYAPKNSGATADLVHWLIEVEHAYMNRVGDISSGEFDFEPLKGENAGEPIYLTRLSSEALAGYGNDLARLSKQLPALTARCARPKKLQVVSRSVENVLQDLQRVQESRAKKA